MSSEKKLAAVYGSLRNEMHNHGILGDSELIGEYDTEPIYDMYSIGSYPGLKENGNTSIKMEVYEISDEIAKALDTLEGYNPDDDDNHYDKIYIDTPYGKACTYIYNFGIGGKVKVESGDWVAFKKGVKKQIEELDNLSSRHGNE